MRFAALLLLSTTAYADSDAIHGATLDEAHTASIRSDDSCLPSCKLVVDKSVQWKGMTVAVRHVTPDTWSSRGYVLTFSSKTDAWVWATDDTSQYRNPEVGVTEESSGMGKSLNEKLDAIEIEQHGDVIWAHFFVTSRFTRWNDGPRGSTSTSHREQAIGCRLADGNPHCRSFLGELLKISGESVRIKTFDDATGKPKLETIKM